MIDYTPFGRVIAGLDVALRAEQGADFTLCDVGIPVR